MELKILMTQVISSDLTSFHELDQVILFAHFESWIMVHCFCFVYTLTDSELRVELHNLWNTCNVSMTTNKMRIICKPTQY